MCPSALDALLGDVVGQIEEDVAANTAAVSVAGDPRTDDMYPEVPALPFIGLIQGISKNVVELAPELGICRTSVQEYARVVGGGTAPYEFAITRHSTPFGAFFSDPQDAILELNCADIGLVQIQIMIRDSLLQNSDIVDTWIQVTDNASVCGGGS
jgi:hypothetical protein